MSSKRASGSGPVLDHEPSFDTDFEVPDEALNARPDGRARAGRPSTRAPARKKGGRVGLIIGILVVLAAGGALGFKLLSKPEVEAPVAAPVAAPAPAPVAATPEGSPAPAAVPTPPKAPPTPPPAPPPVAEAPVTKVAPTVIAAPQDEPEEAPALEEPKKGTKKKGKRSKTSEEPDERLDSALEKLNALEGAAAPAPEPEPVAPAAPSPGAECEAGKAEACVSFGKSLANKDFNAALTAFERGCALGANKGCLEGTRMAEKAGGGEKARELSSIACGRGSATGCRLLASLFQRGVGGAPDADKAKTFYAKACEAGDTEACGQ